MHEYNVPLPLPSTPSALAALERDLGGRLSVLVTPQNYGAQAA